MALSHKVRTQLAKPSPWLSLEDRIKSNDSVGLARLRPCGIQKGPLGSFRLRTCAKTAEEEVSGCKARLAHRI